jgi:hypothetical protein
MNLHDFSNFAVLGYSVSGTTTMDQMIINGVNGSNVAQDEGSVMVCGLTGSASISDSSIFGGFEDSLRVANSSGSLNRLTISNSNFATDPGVQADDAALFDATGTATMNVTVNNGSDFTAAKGDLLNYTLSNTAVGDLVLDGNAFSNNHPSIVSGGGGVTIGAGGGGSNPTLTYTINNNTFKNALGNALTLSTGLLETATGTYTGTVSNNTIGLAGVPGSGSAQGSGVRVIHIGNGTHKISVTNNTIRSYQGSGINMLQTGSSGNPIIRATITSNIITEPTGAGSRGILTDMALTSTACYDIGGAGGLANSLSTAGAVNDIALFTFAGSTVTLPGGPTTAPGAPAGPIQTFIAGRNSGNGAPTVSVDTTAAFSGAGANCL